MDRRGLGLAPQPLLDGSWEIRCTRAIAQRLREGPVAWDVGVDLGDFALLMADLVGPQGQVQALEPEPRLAHRLGHARELDRFAGGAALRQAADQAGRRGRGRR